MKKKLSAVLALALLCSLMVPAASAAGTAPIALSYAVFDNPAVKGRWEEAYWAAPVVADLDGDGKLDVVSAAYTVTAVDAATGKVKWQTDKGPNRIYCTPVAADLDGDGKKEVVVGYGEGTVTAFDCRGAVRWSQKAGPNNEHVRALTAADLDRDGKLEVIVGIGGGKDSLKVFNYDGSPRAGWSTDAAGSYMFGIWLNGVTTGDLDHDGLPEIIAPTDNPFINAFNADGSLVMAGSAFGANYPWCKVGLYEDYQRELNSEEDNAGYGWGLSMESLPEKGRAGTYIAENGQAVARYVDVDGDGECEVVVCTLIADRTNYYTMGGISWTTGSKDSKYVTVAIYNQDRTRFNKNGCNWEKIPTDQIPNGPSGPLYYDAGSFSCGVECVPVVADVNGDGVNEILYNAFDGKVHCFSLKDSQHELAGWPFKLPNTTGSQFELPGAVACADLNGDGKQEVVFSSAIKDKNGEVIGTGALYVVGGDGKLMGSTKLHLGIEEGGVNTPNGTAAGVVVQDVDGDGKYEVLVNTRKYGLCCYKITMERAQGGTTQPAKPDQTSVQAAPTNDKLTVDGRPAAPAAYKIDGANYFKLRDVAMLVNGTKGQFSVDYDGTVKAIKLVTGQPYRPVGGELGNAPTKSEAAVPTNDLLYINGAKVELPVYKIGGANYFKVRDLCKALGFNAGWAADRGMFIESDKPYTDAD